MQTQRRVWMPIQQYNVVSFVVSVCSVLIFGFGIVGRTPHEQASIALASTPGAGMCARTDRVHSVVAGDQMDSIAAYYGLPEGQLAAYNHLALNSTLQTNQSICIPGEEPQTQFEPGTGVSTGSHDVDGIGSARRAMLARKIAPVALRLHTTRRVEQRDHPAAPAYQAVPTKSIMSVTAALQKIPLGLTLHSGLAVAAGTYNAFPFGQCTWWAAERYYQLHNVFVPWTYNANAGQWVDRALNFGWHVSSVPVIGSILVLQSGIEGATGAGHVGIVEQVNNDGSVIASSMNWGNHPGAVTNSLFYSGPGVSFISQ